MNNLDEDAKKAMELGMTYGKYMLMKGANHDLSAKSDNTSRSLKRKRRHTDCKYTDAQLFALWQARMTDAEIAEAANISRATVQRWRDAMELPSAFVDKNIDVKKYRMVQTPYGGYVVKNEEN